MRPVGGALTEQDHDLGVEHVHEPGDGAAEEVARLAEDSRCAVVTRVRGIPQRLDSSRRADDAPFTGDAHECVLAEEGLEAAVVAARAQGPVVAHGSVADLSRSPSRTAQDHAVDDDRGADAGTDRDDEEAVVAATQAVQALGHGEGVDVVLDEDGQAELAAQALPDRGVGPAQLGRVDDALALTVDVARHADADAEQRSVGTTGDETAQQLDELREHGRGRGVEGFARRAQHGAVDADLDEGDVIGGDLDTHGAAGARDEPEHAGGAAPLGRLVGELAQEAVGQEVLGELRHERGREVERPGELGARRGAVCTEVRQDRGAIDVGASHRAERH